MANDMIYSKNSNLRFDLIKPGEWHELSGRYMVIRERAAERPEGMRKRYQFGFDADTPIKCVAYERDDKAKDVWHVLDRFGEDTLKGAIEYCETTRESDECRRLEEERLKIKDNHRRTVRFAISSAIDQWKGWRCTLTCGHTKMSNAKVAPK